MWLLHYTEWLENGKQEDNSSYATGDGLKEPVVSPKLLNEIRQDGLQYARTRRASLGTTVYYLERKVQSGTGPLDYGY